MEQVPKLEPSCEIAYTPLSPATSAKPSCLNEIDALDRFDLPDNPDRNALYKVLRRARSTCVSVQDMPAPLREEYHSEVSEGVRRVIREDARIRWYLEALIGLEKG
jgi:hypothetical protein